MALCMPLMWRSRMISLTRCRVNAFMFGWDVSSESLGFLGPGLRLCGTMSWKDEGVRGHPWGESSGGSAKPACWWPFFPSFSQWWLASLDQWVPSKSSVSFMFCWFPVVAGSRALVYFFEIHFIPFHAGLEIELTPYWEITKPSIEEPY